MAPQSQTPLVLRTLLYSLAHPLALYSSHSRLASPNRTDIDQLFPSQKELEFIPLFFLWFAKFRKLRADASRASAKSIFHSPERSYLSQ